MHKIALLAAFSINHVIGSEGKIPWNLPSERIRFKAICKGKYIIMGRKSFDEIGHGLPYCTIIIVSKKMKEAPKGCVLAATLDDALKIAEKNCTSLEDEILVAGGAEIYKQTFPLCSKIYGTVIQKKIKGDTFFPQIPETWKKETESCHLENGIEYHYVTWTSDN